MNDNIKRLQKQIESEKRKIANCKHDFDKSFYNSETVREPYGYKMVAQGSDVWGEPQGYHDVKKDRWTRKCKVCGFEQHTYSQKPIVSGYEPSF
jgi:hypothetical protein